MYPGGIDIAVGAGWMEYNMLCGSGLLLEVRDSLSVHPTVTKRAREPQRVSFYDTRVASTATNTLRFTFAWQRPLHRPRPFDRYPRFVGSGLVGSSVDNTPLHARRVEMLLMAVLAGLIGLSRVEL